jgi:carboxyl-terminal processing protease
MIGTKMKKLLILANIAFVFTINAQNGQIDTNKVLVPENYHTRVNQAVSIILTKRHFEKRDLNDSLSSVIFDDYLKTLDYNKLYFVKSDVDEFEIHRYKVDDYLLKGDLNFAFDVFNKYKTRLNQRMVTINERLEEEFDFDIDEKYTPNRKDAEWALTNEELDEIWRKRIKNNALNKKLNKETWDKISSSLKKRYSNFHKVILQYKAEDVFQLYINSFAGASDPHSNYLSPITSENFGISMSRAFEGIGARLRSIDDYTTIVSIMPGGPAERSNNIFEDDRIVGVAQGDDGEMVDVYGWRIDDVVQLIRGEKGTMVRLQLLRANNTPDMPTDEITLVRDKIKLEEQSAKSEIIYINQDDTSFKLGVIDIPAFYVDFKAKGAGDVDYKSTTRDVKKLLAELMLEKVDGIIIDLRENGGGSLQEAIDLTGLFIEDGPVVQVKDSRGLLDVYEDEDPTVYYDGPLGVMINRYSASASEIFSAAIQDYGRGIVLGEQTFGKGTVQNLMDLNRFIPIKKQELGQVKLTIAKFYRVTGSSTQKLGVMPDISFPSIGREDFGESSYAAALKWDLVNSAHFERYDDLQDYFPALLEKHKARIAKDIEFQFIYEDIEEYKENKNKKTFSLNQDIRMSEREKSEAKREAREEARQKKVELNIASNEVESEESRIEDPVLDESGRILSDFIAMKYGGGSRNYTATEKD